MSDEPVVPITPELAAVADEPHQHLRERMVRQYAEFSAAHGTPQAYALVLIDAEGTVEPYFQTEPGAGGWRSFLALAGALLTERAVRPDSG